MSQAEKDKVNGAKAPKDDKNHDALLLARAEKSKYRFRVKMSTEQYQAIYDAKWA